MRSIVALILAAMLACSNAFMSSPTFAARSVTCPTTSSSLNVDITVKVGEGEPIESALRRFKREVNKSGHLFDLRHKRYHENAQEKRKRKTAQARQRKRFERMQRRRMQQQNRV